MTQIRKVRSIVKFKRSVKAISPVIATLLMIAIAVVASLVVYAWVTGYIGGTTTTAGKAIQIQSFAPQGSNLLVYVQNVGQGDVQLNKDQSVYVDSNLVSISNPSSATIPITVGQTVELTVPLPAGYVKGDKLNIKVTTTDGTFMTATGTGSTGGGSGGTQYTVTVNPGTNGAITPATGPVNSGSSPTYTITAATGYHIVDVQVDAVSQGAVGTYTFTNVQAVHTISATFAINTVQYTITVNPGTNGAITPATGPVNSGSSPTYTITAATGYHIVDVQVDAVSQGAVGTYTFTNVQAVHTISATFAINTVQYTITVNPGTNGAITPATGPVNSGSSPTYTITAATGYHIVDVQVDAVSQGAVGTYTFTNVQAVHTISATFAINTAVATKLVFSAGAPQTLTAGVVSPTAIVVQRQDASNNPVSTGTAQITVTLTTGSSGGAFYSNSGGTSAITSITIAAGSSSSASFYYKDTVASTSRTLTGASNGLTSATTNFVINAGTATKLAFTVAPTTVVHHAISTVFTVQIQDAYGNAATRGSTTTVTLTDNDQYGVFYSDSAGNNVITSINIASGSSTANFYWEHDRTSSTGQYTITATPNGGLASASTNINAT